jgi:hypothetical protein
MEIVKKIGLCAALGAALLVEYAMMIDGLTPVAPLIRRLLANLL